MHAEDADYIRRMMAKVEGMPLAALENGVPVEWATFGQYLGALDGRLGSERRMAGRPLRPAAKSDGRGPVARRPPSEQEIAKTRAVLAERSSAEMGLGTRHQSAATPTAKEPWPSPPAARNDAARLCDGGRHSSRNRARRNLQRLPRRVHRGAGRSAAARRCRRRGAPLNWNVLPVDAEAADTESTGLLRVLSSPP